MLMKKLGQFCADLRYINKRAEIKRGIRDILYFLSIPSNTILPKFCNYYKEIENVRHFGIKLTDPTGEKGKLLLFQKPC